jgi:hypothetical protein
MASRRLLAWAVTAALVGVVGSAPAAQADVATSAYQTAATNISGLAAVVINSYQQQSSPTDTRYYSNGLWISDDMGCWPCNLGPAVADAVLARHDASRLPVVVASFNRALQDHQAPDGSFVGGPDSPGIQTAEFVPELGIALVALDSKLSGGTRAAWTSAITRGADYLINSGDTTWYANGNINLQYAEVLYLAWRVSGLQRYADAYNAEWTFVTSPPTPRWNGYGLVLTKVPSKADGSDGAGYLTEQGTGAPGFDPEYTQLQLDVASALYVLSHDARALRLMNLLLNQDLPRVDSSFTLDATGGSRHSLLTPFMTSGLALLVHYGRGDLVGRLPAQTARIDSEYQTYMVYTHRNYYFGLSRWLAPLMLDADGVTVQPTVATSGAQPGSTASPSTPLRSSAVGSGQHHGGHRVVKRKPRHHRRRATHRRPKRTSARGWTASREGGPRDQSSTMG